MKDYNLYFFLNFKYHWTNAIRKGKQILFDRDWLFLENGLVKKYIFKILILLIYF